jgi:hypothetical protein
LRRHAIKNADCRQGEQVHIAYLSAIHPAICSRILTINLIDLPALYGGISQADCINLLLILLSFFAVGYEKGQLSLAFKVLQKALTSRGSRLLS